MMSLVYVVGLYLYCKNYSANSDKDAHWLKQDNISYKQTSCPKMKFLSSLNHPHVIPNLYKELFTPKTHGQPLYLLEYIKVS